MKEIPLCQNAKEGFYFFIHKTNLSNLVDKTHDKRYNAKTYGNCRPLCAHHKVSYVLSNKKTSFLPIVGSKSSFALSKLTLGTT